MFLNTLVASPGAAPDKAVRHNLRDEHAWVDYESHAALQQA